jgi:hypothetical protein
MINNNGNHTQEFKKQIQHEMMILKQTKRKKPFRIDDEAGVRQRHKTSARRR